MIYSVFHLSLSVYNEGNILIPNTVHYYIFTSLLFSLYSNILFRRSLYIFFFLVIITIYSNFILPYIWYSNMSLFMRWRARGACCCC